MKNVLWVLFLLGFMHLNAQAQEDGGKLAKKAKKAITGYFLDPTNKENLSEAKTLIDNAFATGSIDNDYAAWAVKGEIYGQLAQADASVKMVTPDAKSKNPEAADIAFNAYNKSLTLAPKESAKKDAFNGLVELIPLLSTSGLEFFYAQDYPKAYRDFNSILKAYDVLKVAKYKTALDEPKDLNNQYYITALAAYHSGNLAEAGTLYEQSLKGGNKTAEVYDGLFRSYMKSDPSKAEKFLAEGRAAFPDDNNLLFSEINLYLSQGKLNDLISKLELASSKEPDNISVVNTLGNVYDKLYQDATEKGDTSNANKFLDKAMETYQKALAKEPTNNFANYSMGTLYYNKAASYVTLMNSLAEDLTKDGMKKYDAAQASMLSMFDKALPFFLQAEKSDANDKNTLIALREIYARKNQMDKAEEYKKKMEALK